jgi:hypothetical protein
MTNSLATKMPLAGGTFTGNVDIDAKLTVDQNTSGQMVTSFEGLNGRVHIGRYGHILQQNTDDSTTEFWSTATRFDGSFDIAFGTSTNEGVVASSNAIISITQAGATTFNGDVTLTGANYNAVWDKSDNALEFSDNAKATFGTGADLTIRHQSSNNTSYIEETGTGHLVIKGHDTYIQNEAGNQNIARFVDGGGVKLFYQGVVKAETVSGGFDVTGNLETSGNIELGHASDTTISRASAGVIAVEGKTISTVDDVTALAIALG